MLFLKNIIDNSKYSKTYFSLIEKSLNQNREKLKTININYIRYDNHHILPKSIFPEYSNLKKYKWNGVLLTPREHLLCHILIWKHYKKLNLKKETHSMNLALIRMKTSKNYNSKIYEKLQLTSKRTISSIEKQSLSMVEYWKNMPPKEYLLRCKQNKLQKQKVWNSQSQEQRDKQTGRGQKNLKKGNPQSQEKRKQHSLLMTGSGNSKAKTIQIYNTNNDIMFICNGDFKTICKDNNLPLASLAKSYRKNGIPIYNSKRGISTAKKLGFDEYIDWYAKII